MPYTTDDIRNLALLGQAGAGKTTLSEALLHTAGVVATKGEVGRKTTVSDQDVLEKIHQRSLTVSVMSFDYNDRHINLIDTPGYSDLQGLAMATTSAVETVVIVVNAQSGVEIMTKRFMEWAKNANACTAIVVNKIDAHDVELESVYNEIQEELGIECLALNLPGNNRDSVISCLFEEEGSVDFSTVEDAHIAIADQIVEVDEDLMEDYLETGEIPADKIAPVFKQALRESHLTPVFFTSAETDVGVQQLLDAICELFPNPKEGNLPEFGVNDSADTIPVKVDSNADLLAHVFKVAFDPFIGKLGVFRIFEGCVNKDDAIYVGDVRKPVKLSNLYSVLGKTNNDVTQGVAGDICAASKIDELEQNAIIDSSGKSSTMHLKLNRFPSPMVGLAIAPATRGEEQKVAESLQKIAAEDPCITLDRNPVANETIIRGLGDLHLRIALERLNEVYNVEVTTSVPTIPYKETITRISEGHCRHKKQTGGAGQFGEVYMRVEPLPRGEGFEFVDNIVGGVIPSQFIPAVEKGVRQVLDNGAFAGFPMQDIRVVVHDGKHHSVDSKEIAFIMAGKKAFIDAVKRANPVVLEPITDVSVVTPSANMGDIAGELSARRGRISDTEAISAASVKISGSAPLAQMSDFQSRLNAITGGEGSFIMEFGSYEPAPMEIQKKLSAEFSQPEED